MDKQDDTAPVGQQIAVAPAHPKPPIVASEAILSIVPKDLDEAYRYAQMIWKSGTAPDSYDNDPQKIVIGVLSSMELGVPPMTGLRNIAIINKRPAIWGDLAIALCQSKGVIKSFDSNFTGTEGEDDYTANVVIWRKGQDTPYEGHFSVKDAKRANLWMNARKQPWVMYPNRMLFNRARAFALRDGFADCLAGLAIAEEVQDLPAEPKLIEANVLEDAPAETETSKVAAE